MIKYQQMINFFNEVFEPFYKNFVLFPLLEISKWPTKVWDARHTGDEFHFGSRQKFRVNVSI